MDKVDDCSQQISLCLFLVSLLNFFYGHKQVSRTELVQTVQVGSSLKAGNLCMSFSLEDWCNEKAVSNRCFFIIFLSFFFSLGLLQKMES